LNQTRGWRQRFAGLQQEYRGAGSTSDEVA
jgi:hypothetical protein